jgi:hypothetical protein
MIDSTVVTGDIHNPENHQVKITAVYTNADSSTLDSLDMFDDGQHGDSLANDNRYGGFLGPFSDETHYQIEVRTTDLDTTFTHFRYTNCTTVGPVAVVAYEVSETIPNVLYSLEVSLKNDGSTATATNVTVEIETADTNVTNITHFIQSFGNIEPGQIKNSVVASFVTQNNPNDIDFNLHILSDDIDFWSDSINVIITGIAKNETNIPKEYILKQNYPNPFNPTTNINFSIPRSEFVTLKVYNILGEEVATLVSEKLSVGSYQYEWNASSLASGVYLFRIEAGDYIESRKMVLMR